MLPDKGLKFLKPSPDFLGGPMYQVLLGHSDSYLLITKDRTTSLPNNLCGTATANKAPSQRLASILALR